MNFDHQNGNALFHASQRPLEYGALLKLAINRSIRYPVATGTAVAVSFGASELASAIPTDALWLWFVRAFVSVFVGYLVLLSLVFMSVATPDRGLRLPDGSRVLLLAGAIVATLLSLPIAILGTLSPESSLIMVLPSWVAQWADATLVALGVVWPAAVWPSLIIGWQLSIRHGLPLTESMRFVKRDVEGKSYQPLRWTIVVGLFGCVASITPWITICVVPLTTHLCVVLAENCVDDRA